MTEEEYAKKISKYSKKEIIDALLKLRGSLGFDLALSKLLTELESTSLNKHETELDRLGDESVSLFKLYNDWLRRMANLYGDGSTVSFADIPEGELEHGSDLLNRYKAVNEKYDKLNKKINSLYEV